METAILAIFTFLLFIIFLYSLVQLNLLLNYRKNLKNKPDAEKWDFKDISRFPNVTIQLPLYNEKPVVERLLKNIARIDYPKNKLEIQVLDDSTDDSLEITRRLVREIQSTGIDMRLLHRTKRTGFKAGALKEGLKSAKGEFIAIFDSDFLPKPDWLKKTLPYFKNDKIGVVQTRWGHLNRNYSLLTKLQAFLLDFHFILEQNGRNAGHHFINFNGTAGIWRKSCIMDAGNWSGDTLTEDLDLSYRAQLKGWKFKYLEEVETPAELPITINAAKSQQFRWNKGAAENFQKNFSKMLRKSGIPLGTKIHSFFHLLNSSLFLLVFVLSLISVPLLFTTQGSLDSIFGGILTFFSISTLIFFLSYWVSFSKTEGSGLRSFFKYCWMFFTFFSIAMGFSLHNSRAVLEGHFGKKSAFIRTPKFNIAGKSNFKEVGRIQITGQLILEILLICLFAFAIYSAFKIENYRLILFHFMLFFGFAYVVLTSLFPAGFTRWRKPRTDLNSDRL
ncbi:cellulose synthase family protein [Salinimicrobium gaetbulicola]|uniref:Cellulose synthase family protein n=1 Tax=Salinimicrobium gaetbulicola TaxID=999702 RepID=A0ABW3IJZ1_9FLAO